MNVNVCFVKFILSVLLMKRWMMRRMCDVMCVWVRFVCMEMFEMGVYLGCFLMWVCCVNVDEVGMDDVCVMMLE